MGDKTSFCFIEVKNRTWLNEQEGPLQEESIMIHMLLIQTIRNNLSYLWFSAYDFRHYVSKPYNFVLNFTVPHLC